VAAFLIGLILLIGFVFSWRLAENMAVLLIAAVIFFIAFLALAFMNLFGINLIAAFVFALCLFGGLKCLYVIISGRSFL